MFPGTSMVDEVCVCVVDEAIKWLIYHSLSGWLGHCLVDKLLYGKSAYSMDDEATFLSPVCLIKWQYSIYNNVTCGNDEDWGNQFSWSSHWVIDEVTYIIYLLMQLVCSW